MGERAVVLSGLFEKVTFEQRLEAEEKASHGRWDIWEKNMPVGENNCKVLVVTSLQEDSQGPQYPHLCPVPSYTE